MKCEVTNFAIPNKNSSYEVPFYRSVTPHRRKRCGAFEKEGLICTDGKGFGSCKGKTSQLTLKWASEVLKNSAFKLRWVFWSRKGSSSSILSCLQEDKIFIIGIGGIIHHNATCEKVQVLYTISKVVWIRFWLRARTTSNTTRSLITWFRFIKASTWTKWDLCQLLRMLVGALIG